ncbi:MAG: DNA polymerase III subunit delta [Firmicutes bacterium HGW-Firmicutes-8]|nr:MAG: DNA polymerase III subunit delta [Firmicutes bacterium HGW-Firmicutes-8]
MGMDYIALDKSLARGVISPVYLFFGEETYLRDRYLARFLALIPEEVRDFNTDIVDGRDVEIEAVINMATTLPFMSERRLVVVKNADFFKTRRKTQVENGPDTEGKTNKDLPEDREDHGEKGTTVDNTVLAYLESPPASTCLIFCTDSVDKKRRIYKMLEKKGQVVEFSSFKGRSLNEWIEHRARQLGKVIEPAAVAGLVTAVGSSLQHLSTELEKLACCSGQEKITAADVGQMVGKTVELSIFELVDAVGERNHQKAIKMAREMAFLGEPVIKILFMVARQFRLLMRVKGFQEQGYTGSQLAGKMQVHPFVTQKCIKQAKNFTLPELKSAMEKILSADADIKNGRQEAILALELLIISLCEKK